MNKSQILIFLTAAAFTAGSAQAVQTAFWDFEGSDPANRTDSVSNTVGTLNGTAATDGTGIAPTGSSSLSLDGSGATFTTGTAGGLGGTGSFTVFTFLQTTTTSDGVFFSYSPTDGVTGGADLRLMVQGNGDLRIEMSAGAGFNLSSGDFNLGDGSTHAVAAVFGASAGGSFQDVDLYVDGTLYDVTGGTDHEIDLGAENNIIVGTDQVGQRAYNGLVDNLSIYDTALSLTELDTLAATGAIPEPSAAALLLGVGVLGLLVRRRR